MYVPRRDTSSRIAALAGGRLFPGWQHAARFHVAERDDTYRVEVASRDGDVRIAVAARVVGTVMAGSIFGSLDEASAFFRCAPTGYSATPRHGVFDGVELRTDGWGLEPLQVDAVASSFFEDATRFPRGSVVLDSAFLMSGLDTAWQARAPLVAHTAS